MCLFSSPLMWVKRPVSCWGAFPFDKCLDIHLQKGSVFCIWRRASNLSAVGDLGIGVGTGETSGVILGCVVKVSGVGCWWVWLLLLKAGPSVFETDSMLISAEVVWGNSTRHDRQSATLFLAPDIHSNVIVVGCQLRSPSTYFVICILSIQKFGEWLVIISAYDICTLEIVIPLGDSIVNSIGLLFSCAPLSLGFKKVWDKKAIRNSVLSCSCVKWALQASSDVSV